MPNPIRFSFWSILPLILSKIIDAVISLLIGKTIRHHQTSVLLVTGLVLSFYFSSCKDIIEPSIKEKKTTLVAPADNFSSQSYRVNFWWEEVEDANAYNVQIVSGTFAMPQNLIADSLVRSNKLGLDMAPGQYQWRVKALNGSSETKYSFSRNLTILEGSFSQQQVGLKSPAVNFVTANPANVYTWNELYSAELYHLQIDTANFANENQLVYDLKTFGATASFTFKKNAIYQWRVRAEKSAENSKWSSINLITFKQQLPEAPTLLQPQNAAFVSSPISLKWSASAEAVTYRLYIYQADGQTPFNNNFPLTQKGTTFSLSTTIKGTFYWEVRALNSAGDESKPSGINSFTIQ